MLLKKKYRQPLGLENLPESSQKGDDEVRTASLRCTARVLHSDPRKRENEIKGGEERMKGRV